MKLKIIILCYIIFPIAILAQSDYRRFERVQFAQNYSQNNILCFIQDHKGFLWIGTEDGLYKYDGYSIKVFRNEKDNPLSLSSNFITSIIEDEKGFLWLTTNGGGLNRLNIETETFKRFTLNDINIDNSENSVLNISYNTANSKLWIGGHTNGLILFDKTDFTSKFFRIYPPEKGNSERVDIRYINQADTNHLWVASSIGVIKFNSQTGKYIVFDHEDNNSNSLIDNDVNICFTDSQGTLWVGSNHGLSRLINKNKGFEKIIYNKSGLETWSKHDIFSILEDEKQNLWIGTNNGLKVYDLSTSEYVTYTHNELNHSSLTSNSISALYADKSGIIWIGTSEGGVNKYDPKTNRFLHIQHKKDSKYSLSKSTIRSVFIDNDSIIWAGTTEDGLNLINRKTKTIYHIKRAKGNKQGLSSNSVNTILVDSKRNLWIGTTEGLDMIDLNGIDFDSFDINKIQYKHFYSNKSDKGFLSANSITCVFEDSKKRFWVGTGNAGLNLMDKTTEKFSNFQNDPNNPRSICHNSVQSNSIIEDNQGNLWIGTWGGLNKLKIEGNKYEFTHFKHNPGDISSLSDDRVISLCKDINGVIWAGTCGGGLNKVIIDYNNEKVKFKSYKSVDGLPNGVIYGIECDSKGHLWLSTNSGLAEFDPENEKFRNYTIDDGLQSNNFFWGAASKGKNGEMAFGGINGLNVFFPDKIRDLYKPPIELTDLQLFNNSIEIDAEVNGRVILRKTISDTKKIELSHKDYVVTFKFAALDFVDSKAKKYAYILENFEKNWNVVGSNRNFATYTNLPHGKYIFKVKCTNRDGVWNKTPKEIVIVVLPPYYKTWWFRLLMIVFLVGSAFTFYKMRTEALKRQKRELEKQVRIKTAEVWKQNEEIRLQAEHIKGSIRAAKTIQTAILPIRNEINKYFETFILYRPKDIVSGDFYYFSNLEPTKNQHLFFCAVVDCTGHGVPGAFMSMIGNRLLDEIIRVKNIVDPSQILEMLDQGVRKALKQDQNQNDDGMDVCLCRIEKNESDFKVVFAGAKRNLIYYDAGDKQTKITKATRRSIGGRTRKRSIISDFNNQELILTNNSVLYLTTDGYSDQNGPDRKKIGIKRLFYEIGNISSLAIEQQFSELEKMLDNHQKESSQRDDITVLGLKLNTKYL